MALNKKIIERCYKPYLDESLYAFIRDIAISFACVLFLIIIMFLENRFEKELIVTLSLIMILLFMFILLTTLGIPILSAIERKYCGCKESKLRIERVELEYCFFTGIKGRSCISKLYPETMGIDRFKIICRDENNKKVKLRSIMSKKKDGMILDYIEAHKEENLLLTYGKLTKIVLYYKDSKGNALDWNYRL